MKTVGIAVAAALLLAGCAITQNVRPVTATRVEMLCIKNNKDVMMDGFLPELRKQVEAKGIRTQVYDAAPPADCRHRLEYTANWRWDLAMYLVYANLRVTEGDVTVGEATYDARAGGGNMSKFGNTADKMRPLIDQLFPKG